MIVLVDVIEVDSSVEYFCIYFCFEDGMYCQFVLDILDIIIDINKELKNE